MQATTLVIPCYNEAQRLRCAEFVDFLRSASDFYLLFVDDGSTDATQRILNSICDQCPNQSRVLHLANNCGKAEAVRQGILRALDSNTSFIGYWDADLATPLDSAVRMQQVLSLKPHLQAVLGTRTGIHGRRILRRRKRALLGRLFSLAASTVLGTRVADTQCGAKMFRAQAPLQHIMAEPFLSKWSFDVELLLRLRKIARSRNLGLADFLWEEPLDYWREVSGSKLSSRDMLQAGWDLAKIGFQYRGRRLIKNLDCEPTPLATKRTVVVENQVQAASPQILPFGKAEPKLPVISGLWIGELTPLEQICIESFLRRGHRYELYTYMPLEHIPQGVCVRDAREILPAESVFQNRRGSGSGSYASFADLFRYKLLAERGGFWVDTDVYCVRPFDFAEPYVFGGEDVPVANGIIKAPAGSDLLQASFLEAAKVDCNTIQWRELGDVFAQQVIKQGLLKFVKPSRVFSPIPYYDIAKVVRSNNDIKLPPETYGVHLYQEIWRRKRLDKFDLSSRNSLLRALRELTRSVSRREEYHQRAA